MNFHAESIHPITKTSKENRFIPRHILQNFRTLAKNIQISREKVGHKG